MSASEWIAQDALHNLDLWVAALNRQAVGTAMVGYKANDVTFGGGPTATQKTLAGGTQQQIGEQQLYMSQYVDFSQGDIQASDQKTHLAIRGSGMFAVAKDLNAGTAVSYTRNGEFHKDANGFWRTREGYYLLGADDVDPQGNVVRDPAAYGRTYPPASLSEPFGPGALGITDTTFNGSVSALWGPAVGGAAPANYTINMGTQVINRGAGPNAVNWTANNWTVGQDGKADVGWDANSLNQPVGPDPNGDGKSLHYGGRIAGSTYASGNNSAQSLDVVIDWTTATDTDLQVIEPDLPTPVAVDYTNKTNNGFLNRDTTNGTAYPGSPTDFSQWDEWYKVNLTARASGAAPVAEGLYTARIRYANQTGVSYRFVEDVGSIHEKVVASGTGDFVIGQDIASSFMANRRNTGTVWSREYALDPTFGTTDIAFSSAYDLDNTVGALGDERDASVDMMTWGYRLNGTGAFTTFTVPKAAFTQSWQDVSASLATAGATSIQFMWNFDTVDGKENDGKGWFIDNLRINQTGATNPWVQVNVTDIGNSLPPGSKLAVYDGTTEGTRVTVTEGSYVNVPYTGTWPIIDAEIRIYDPSGNLVASNPYAFLKSNAKIDVSVAFRRGVEPAEFLDPNNRLGDSTYGYSYYTPKSLSDVPTWDQWKSSTNPTGPSLVKGALEGSNSNLYTLSPELTVAKRTYDMVSKILSMRKSSFDQLAGLIH